MNVLQLIDELEQLVENSGGGLLGKRLINEKEVIAKVQQLRAAAPPSANSLRFMDELEQLVKNSKFRFSGKCLIDEETFFTLTQRLRMVLS